MKKSRVSPLLLPPPPRTRPRACSRCWPTPLPLLLRWVLLGTAARTKAWEVVVAASARAAAMQPAVAVVVDTSRRLPPHLPALLVHFPMLLQLLLLVIDASTTSTCRNARWGVVGQDRWLTDAAGAHQKPICLCLFQGYVDVDQWVDN